MRFRDLPKFTNSGHYAVNVSWNFLEQQLEHYMERHKGIAPLEMNPDFQRGHVWTQEQQIAFVEFGLQGGQTGKDIWFNCVGWMSSFKGPFVLVDGLQRLTSVLEFKQNKFPVFDKYYFNDFTDSMDLIRTDFIFHINDLDSRDKILKWYIEMNSGGVVHTQEEINRVKQLLKEEKAIKKE